MAIHDPSPTQHVIETTVIGLSNKSVVLGSLGSFFGWLADSGGTALVAMLIALLGLVINSYFQWKRHEREQLEFAHQQILFDLREARDTLEHESRMASFRAQYPPAAPHEAA